VASGQWKLALDDMEHDESGIAATRVTFDLTRQASDAGAQ
jgi:hypothetical protein